jgi:hypothetical protein
MLRREFKELCSYGTGIDIFAGIRNTVAHYYCEQFRLSRDLTTMKLTDYTKRLLTIYARLYPVKIDTRNIWGMCYRASNEIAEELITQHYRYLPESAINAIATSFMFSPGIIASALSQGFNPNKLLPYPCDLPLICPYVYQPNITLITWAYISRYYDMVDLVLDYSPNLDVRAENGISMRIAVAYKWSYISPKLHEYMSLH